MNPFRTAQWKHNVWYNVIVEINWSFTCRGKISESLVNVALTSFVLFRDNDSHPPSEFTEFNGDVLSANYYIKRIKWSQKLNAVF